MKTTELISSNPETASSSSGTVLITRDLIGEFLDIAVAMCEGTEYSAKTTWDGIGIEYPPTDYSTNLALGGGILEREGISTRCIGHNINGFVWDASSYGEDEEIEGPTALIAGLRCHVFSLLGEKVKIPVIRHKTTYFYKLFRVHLSDGRATTVAVDPVLATIGAKELGSSSGVRYVVQKASENYAKDKVSCSLSRFVSLELEKAISAVKQGSPTTISDDVK